jgi:hypothetical protein
MAIDVEIQRLQLSDVILVDLPDQGGEVEAKVVREIDRIDQIDPTESTVRVTLRVEGQEDFVKEYALGEIVTLVRGP